MECQSYQKRANLAVIVGPLGLNKERNECLVLLRLRISGTLIKIDLLGLGVVPVQLTTNDVSAVAVTPAPLAVVMEAVMMNANMILDAMCDYDDDDDQ